MTTLRRYGSLTRPACVGLRWQPASDRGVSRRCFFGIDKPGFGKDSGPPFGFGSAETGVSPPPRPDNGLIDDMCAKRGQFFSLPPGQEAASYGNAQPKMLVKLPEGWRLFMWGCVTIAGICCWIIRMTHHQGQTSPMTDGLVTTARMTRTDFAKKMLESAATQQEALAKELEQLSGAPSRPTTPTGPPPVLAPPRARHISD